MNAGSDGDRQLERGGEFLSCAEVLGVKKGEESSDNDESCSSSDSGGGSSSSGGDDDEKVPPEKKSRQAEEEEKFYLLLVPISVMIDRLHLCECFECNHHRFTTYDLAYFVYFGLKLKERVNVNRRFHTILISTDILAQVLAIVEERVKRVFCRVFTLREMCLHVIGSQLDHGLSYLNIPKKLAQEVRDFSSCIDVEDKLCATVPGRTVFKPFSFARYLMRHRNRFLKVFRTGSFADRTKIYDILFRDAIENVDADL